ncbi:MAG TPA: M3 family oligoendopeptidase [Planctomycetaceae bacterium]|nr:M3 family oligoendopeptidase [Planctomycetaceae bacterium]
MPSSPPLSAAGITWDLHDLYAGVDDPQIEADLKECATRCTAFAEKYRGLFASPDSLTADTLHAALAEYEQIAEMMSRLSSYAGLLTAADTASDDYRRLEDRLQQQLVERENQLTFFELEWLAVDDKVAESLCTAPALANYAHHLSSSRRYKPHTRSEPEELLLNQKSLTARAAWTTLFDEFVASLEYRLDYKGQVRTLTQPAILALNYDSDRELRKAAQTCFFNELSRHELVLTNIFNAVAQDHAINDQIRRYDSPMAGRHLANEVAPEVVSRMLEAAEANYSIAHDYYRLKARLLGLPKMATYDQYAPVATNMPECRYDAGRQTVLTALGRFHPMMREVAEKFFEQNWIDAEVRPGKRGGAFSASTVPSVHPYILLNWTDKLRDVSTMAHELGHGIHQYLSRRQSYLNFHHPLTVAETASVFAEFLTFDCVMETTSDPEVRLGLICGKVEDAFATVFRQNVLTRFEQSTHAARRKEKLSTGEICDAWWLANQALYGDAVEMFNLYRWGWTYIPHFIHTPFYCYAYVFGELLVLSLYRMYQEEGKAFVPRYIELLESGSNAAPEALLSRVGANIADPAFWQKGLDVLRDMVKKATDLAGSLAKGAQSPVY